jgi:hypothetical protein
VAACEACDGDYSLMPRSRYEPCWRCYRDGQRKLLLPEPPESACVRLSDEALVSLGAVAREADSHPILELLRRSRW